MSRDDLITELQRCPVNSEVEIVGEVEWDDGEDLIRETATFKIDGVDCVPFLRIRLHDARIQ